MKRNPPDWFVRELKAIDSRLNAIWSQQFCKWIIVSPAPINVFRDGYVIEMVVEDENHQFMPLDRRVLHALRAAKYELENGWVIPNYLEMMDIREREKGDRAAKLRREMQTDFLKKCYHFMTKKVFV